MKTKKHIFPICTYILLLLPVIIAIPGANAFADYATNLVFSGYIQDASGDIDVDAYSVPVVYDWNSDGKKDLLVGQRFNHPVEGQNGYISFYENIGTNDSPFFDSSGLIQACFDSCNLLVFGSG